MTLDRKKLEICIANSGMIYRTIAKKSGLSENGFRDLRQGRYNAKPTTIGRIAKTLGVEVTDIIKEGE